MAKRKRLNKRMVILLAVLGLLAVIGAFVVAIPRLFPEAPEALADQAERKYGQGEYRDARDLWLRAIGASKRLDRGLLHEYYYKLALTQLDWADNDKDLNPTQRSGLKGRGKKALEESLHADPSYLPARRRLCEFLWMHRVTGGIGRVHPQANTDEYLREAAELVRQDPQDHQTYFRMGRIKAYKAEALDLGGEWVDKTLEDFRKAIELKTDSAEYWLTLANFLRRRDRKDEAEKVYNEAIAANPADAKIRVNYAGFLLRARADKEKAKEQIREAIARDPATPVGHEAMATVYLSEKEPEKAIESLHAARKIDPTNARVYQRLADLYLRQEKPDQAVAIIRQGLAAIVAQAGKAPADAKSLEALKLVPVRHRLNVFLANLLLGQFSKADEAKKEKLLAEMKACLMQIEQSARDLAEWNEVRGRIAFGQRDTIAGRIALAEGNWDRALKLLRSAYDKLGVQTSLRTIYELIYLYDLTGNPGESDILIEKALKLRPTDKILLRTKIQRDLRLHRYQEASDSVTRLLRADPENTWAQAKKTILRVRMNPEATLPADVSLSPDDIRLLLERVGVMLEERQTEQALRFALDLRERAPKNLDVVAALANLYLEAGKDEEAVKLIQDAQAQNPEDRRLARMLVSVMEKDPDKRHQIRVESIKRDLADEPLRMELALAGEYLRMRKRAEYLRHMQEADKLAPNNPGITERLFVFALSKQDWALAEKYAAKAKEADFDRAGGKTFGARLAVAKGDVPGAIDLLSESVREHPELKGAWVLLGRCYLMPKTADPTAATENVGKAADAFQEAIGKDPGYLSAVVGMVHVAVRQGDKKQEREWVLRARQLPGGRRHPYVMERYLLIEEEATTDETKISQKLIPDRERILEQRPNDLDNRQALGRLYEKAGRQAKAEEMYRSAFDRASNKLGAARLLAGFYVRTGRKAEVDPLFNRMVIAAKPGLAKALVWTVWGQTLAGYSVPEALRAFDQAITEAPKYGGAYRSKAWVLARPPSPRWKEAVDVMTKWLDVAPKKVSTDVKVLCEYLIKAGQPDAAISRLNDILKIDPDDVQALALKGFALAKKGDTGKAEVLLQRAFELNRRYDLPLRYLVNLYFSQRDADRGKEALERLWQLSGRTDDGIKLASFYWTRLREYHHAEQICREILRNDRTSPGRIRATRELLGIYRAQKKWSRMEKLLADARKEFPEEVGFLGEEAWMWNARGNGVRAVAAMTKAIEKAPGNLLVLSDYLFFLLKAKEYDLVLSIAEKHKDREDWALMLSCCRAVALVGRNKLAEADELFVSALKQAKPNELNMVVEWILQAYEVSEAARKLASWERHRPGDLQLHLALADLYKTSQAKRDPKDYSLVLATLRKALKLAKTPQDRVLVNFRLASIEYSIARSGAPARAQHLVEAEKAYKAVLEDSPNHVETLNNLAYLYTNELDQPAKAEPYARRAVKLYPTGPNILDTYGWTLAKLGKHDKAADLLEQAVRLGPSPELRYHLGWVLEQKEEWTRALREYEAASGDLKKPGADKTLKELVTKSIERVRRKSEGGEE